MVSGPEDADVPLMFFIMIFPVLGIGLFFVLPLPAALPIYLVVTGLSIVYHRAMMESPRPRVTTGRRGMIGLPAEVLSGEGRSGQVRCHAEIWSAESEGAREYKAGDQVTVVGCDGLTLRVRGPVPPVPGHPESPRR